MFALYVIASVFSVAALLMCVLAVKTANILPRTFFALSGILAGALAGIIWTMAWIFSEAEKHFPKSYPGGEMQVGIDLGSMVSQLPRRVWLMLGIAFVLLFVLLMVLGSPSWRARLLPK